MAEMTLSSLTEYAEPGGMPNTAFLEGRIRVQYVRCGKPSCHCAHGELHGPYYYRVWRDGMRTRKHYVKNVEIEEVRAACDSHTKYRTLLRSARIRRRALGSEILHACRQAKLLIAS